MPIPDDFPRFSVPGKDAEMNTIRELYWHHFPGTKPAAPLWDDWLPTPGLWPAVNVDGSLDTRRNEWRKGLNGRYTDAEGYLATQQHASIAHQDGWPFPFWTQGKGSWGWHFSFKDTIGPGWRPDELNTTEGWNLYGATDEGITEDGWKINLTEPHASLEAPEKTIDTFESPFIQLRWQAEGLGNVQPFIEWTTENEPEFGVDRRFYFEPIDSPKVVYTMVPMYRHPKWTGSITRLRVNFGNKTSGIPVVIQALFTQYDTRHNINSQNFARGAAKYFHWTRDINFLRDNINKMRLTFQYVMTEHQALERKVVFTDWVGHDARSGLKVNPDGTKEVMSGHGIGNNYWDIIPFGHLDTYATIQYYDALLVMAQIEREILEHPEWGIPGGVLKLDPDALEMHAAEVKAEGNRLFWNEETGRFNSGIDADGKTYDYGFIFLNMEATYYDFATPEHARSIMSWISGERIIEGDTSTREDIYYWRFAPRSTTKRNLEYYNWGWHSPEDIPWGDQVQDGGAVLGFSYFDLISRLNILGPDNAWQRLQEIIRWFDEVRAIGTYRDYYDGSRPGTMQGSGIAGGLGLDMEFLESAMVPQIMLCGFLGFSPSADGFSLNPRLPSDWPELAIDRIRYHDLILSITASRDRIEIKKEGFTDEPCFIMLPEGEWKASYIGDSRQIKRNANGAFEVEWNQAAGVTFERAV